MSFRPSQYVGGCYQRNHIKTCVILMSFLEDSSKNAVLWGELIRHWGFLKWCIAVTRKCRFLLLSYFFVFFFFASHLRLMLSHVFYLKLLHSLWLWPIAVRALLCSRMISLYMKSPMFFTTCVFLCLVTGKSEQLLSFAQLHQLPVKAEDAFNLWCWPCCRYWCYELVWCTVCLYSFMALLLLPLKYCNY